MTSRACRIFLLASTLMASGCAVVPQQSRDTASCAPLFQEYDLYARFEPDEGFDERYGRRVFDPRLSQLRVLLIQNDCQTRSGDLTRLDSLAAAQEGRGVSEGGATLGRAVAVHVGAVTSDAEAARAVAFFRGLGLQSTSIGSPLLGRRVYAGPVTTVDGLNALTGIALEAGFVAPYPSTLFRF
jgi:hypothetical protein